MRILKDISTDLYKTFDMKVCFPIGCVGAYDCMIKGDGSGTRVSGKN